MLNEYGRFYILGGESFLNPEVGKYVQVIIEISEYEPTHRMIDEIKDILNKVEITYIVREFDFKQRFNIPHL